jgi:hypothetical protein
MQLHLEARVAAPLMDALERCVESAREGEEGGALDRAIACWRLAHAFLGKGAERGLATVWQEIEEQVLPEFSL